MIGRTSIGAAGARTIEQEDQPFHTDLNVSRFEWPEGQLVLEVPINFEALTGSPALRYSLPREKRSNVLSLRRID